MHFLQTCHEEVQDRMKHYLAVAVFILFMISGTSYSMDLIIGLVPEQNIFKQVKKYKILEEYIKRKSGIGIHFTILSEHGRSIDDFKQRNLDGAFLCSLIGAKAKEELEVAYIASIVNSDGTATSRSYIFSHRDSKIDNVEQMRFRVMAFVDRATATGYAFPVAFMLDHGISDINIFFKDYFFTGSHDAAIFAVLNKEADIGAAKSSVFNMLARKDARIRKNLKIIFESDEFPSNVLVLRKDLPQGITGHLRSVLINMDRNSDGKEALRRFGAMKFIEARESDYYTEPDISKKVEIINLPDQQF
jgi:phosphonate transport system substrate-binding protein